jgi:hypothetical protein
MGTSGSTDVDGKVTIALLETASRAWTATKSLYFAGSGTATLGSPTATQAVPVSIVAIPAIVGDVQLAGVAHTAAHVLLCTVNDATCTTAGAAVLADVATDGTGHFSIGPVAGLTPTGYTVKAIDSALSGFTAISIAANGTVTPSTLVVTIA